MFFSYMLKQAIDLNPAIAGERSAIRSALRDLVDGRTADPEQRRIISRHNNKKICFCAVLHSDQQSAFLPPGYVASVIEQEFPRSLAFEYQGKVVAFFQGKKAGHKPEPSFTEHLTSFLSAMGMHCGLSGPFSDLYDTKNVYFQAFSALNRAVSAKDPALLFFFEDCILSQLLHNAAGSVPSRFYYTAGLTLLKKHDAQSQISYIETLKTYLECNMSISQTAQKLILHRSSLIDRLSRIRQMMGDELSDPDTRLLLHLILRMEQNETVDTR